MKHGPCSEAEEEVHARKMSCEWERRVCFDGVIEGLGFRAGVIKSVCELSTGRIVEWSEPEQKSDLVRLEEHDSETGKASGRARAVIERCCAVL